MLQPMRIKYVGHPSLSVCLDSMLFAPVPIVSESVFPISCDLGVGFRASPDIALGFPGSVDWRMGFGTHLFTFLLEGFRTGFLIFWRSAKAVGLLNSEKGNRFL